MNTLSDGTTTIEIDQSLFWDDRHSWQPVEQTVERSIKGGLLIDGGELHYGRPITLTGERGQPGWMRLAQLQQCQSWAATFGKRLTLVWMGVSYTVTWRHHDRAIDAQPVLPMTDEQPDDQYVVTLRLMTVTP